MTGWGIAVHGGAGDIERNRLEAARAGCERAALTGQDVLSAGGSAIDAVEAAVRQLEDDPAFNAGRGSVLTRAGTVEVDAGLMDGSSFKAGAVGAVPNLLHPITLARRIMENEEHVLLVGEGALAFAREHGILPEAAESLITPRARERLARWQTEQHPPAGGGTVGAVALDRFGHLAAGTSTGGTTGKRPGRVGDTPLLGCGAYADDRNGACSTTGEGEAIMRAVLAFDALQRLGSGLPPMEAAGAAIQRMAVRTGGHAGLILLDPSGGFGLAHNTRHVAYAFVGEKARLESGIARRSAVSDQ